MKPFGLGDLSAGHAQKAKGQLTGGQVCMDGGDEGGTAPGRSTAGPPIPVLGVAAFANTALLLRLLNSIDYHGQGRGKGCAPVK